MDSNKGAGSNRGEQDKFYFEKSILLDEKSANSTSMYNEIPVVILFGWWGAFDNQLKKYSQIYTKMGYHTIRFSPSNQLCALQKGKHRSYALKLLNLMKYEYKLERNQILIHIFSNGSFVPVYVNCIRILNKEPKIREEFDFFLPNRKGMIFDSSTGHLKSNFFGSIKFANIVLEGQIKTTALRWIVVIFFCILLEIYKIFKDDDYYQNSINYYLKKDDLMMPTLFMYSKKDKISPHDIITKNIEIRKQNFPQQDISSVLFETGEHVKIYVEHSETYLELIEEHIKKCGLGLDKN